MAPTIRVIGLGNRYAGDDAAGLIAARKLRETLGERAEVIEAEMAGLEVLDLMEGADAVILIDAARGGGEVGRIYRLDAVSASLAPTLFPHSTHSFNAADALELGRTLGKLPPTVIVYGIEAGRASAGQAVSQPVDASVSCVVSLINEDVEELSRA